MSTYPSYPLYGGESVTGPVPVPSAPTASQQVSNIQGAIDEINQKMFNLNGGTGSILNQQINPAAPEPSSKSSILDSIISGSNGALDSVFSKLPSGLDPLGQAGKTLDNVTNLSLSRLVAVVLGLIFIAGGIYLFKPAQQTINSAIKTGKNFA